MTLSPIAKRLAVELSLPVPVFYDLDLSRTGIEPQSPAGEANVPALRHRCGVNISNLSFVMFCSISSISFKGFPTQVVKTCSYK